MTLIMTYLLCSTAFTKHSYYAVSDENNNFQHLTSVSFFASADDFFEKCVNGTLTEADIKGSVRRKIKVLPDMIGLFSKNRLFCSFAAAGISCTVGFTVAANTQAYDTAEWKPIE